MTRGEGRGRGGRRAFAPNGFVTFLSDFGIRDPYVAEVKGAILSLAPAVRVVDVTHEVPPQDIRTGAFALTRVVAAFPAGTVHLAVVDPGVGTARRAIVMETAGHAMVGPDNGLLSWAAGPEAVWREWTRHDVVGPPRSRTFHGRDLFGPVAAVLASGRVSFDDCGPVVRDPVVLSWSSARRVRGGVSGEVLVVDRFGNVIVGIPGECLRLEDGVSVRVEVEGRVHPAVVGLYVSDAGLVVHEDSSGWTEVAAPSGRADQVLGVRPRDRVTIRWG